MIVFLALLPASLFVSVSSAVNDYNDALACYSQHECGVPELPEDPAHVGATPQAVHRADELLHGAPQPSVVAVIGPAANVEPPATFTSSPGQQPSHRSTVLATPVMRGPPTA